jgi:hypothetical protein
LRKAQFRGISVFTNIRTVALRSGDQLYLHIMADCNQQAASVPLCSFVLFVLALKSLAVSRSGKSTNLLITRRTT